MFTFNKAIGDRVDNRIEAVRAMQRYQNCHESQ